MEGDGPAEISRRLRTSFTCPICLDLLRDTMTTQCLHRFCNGCIVRSLGGGNRECPTCRRKLPSKRSLRPDREFDLLVKTLFPNGETPPAVGVPAGDLELTQDSLIESAYSIRSGSTTPNWVPGGKETGTGGEDEDCGEENQSRTGEDEVSDSSSGESSGWRLASDQEEDLTESAETTNREQTLNLSSRRKVRLKDEEEAISDEEQQPETESAGEEGEGPNEEEYEQPDEIGMVDDLVKIEEDEIVKKAIGGVDVLGELVSDEEENGLNWSIEEIEDDVEECDSEMNEDKVDCEDIDHVLQELAERMQVEAGMEIDHIDVFESADEVVSPKRIRIKESHLSSLFGDDLLSMQTMAMQCLLENENADERILATVPVQWKSRLDGDKETIFYVEGERAQAELSRHQKPSAVEIVDRELVELDELETDSSSASSSSTASLLSSPPSSVLSLSPDDEDEGSVGDYVVEEVNEKEEETVETTRESEKIEQEEEDGEHTSEVTSEDRSLEDMEGSPTKVARELPVKIQERKGNTRPFKRSSSVDMYGETRKNRPHMMEQQRRHSVEMEPYDGTWNDGRRDADEQSVLMNRAEMTSTGREMKPRENDSIEGRCPMYMEQGLETGKESMVASGAYSMTMDRFGSGEQGIMGGKEEANDEQIVVGRGENGRPGHPFEPENAMTAELVQGMRSSMGFDASMLDFPSSQPDHYRVESGGSGTNPPPMMSDGWSSWTSAERRAWTDGSTTGSMEGGGSSDSMMFPHLLIRTGSDWQSRGTARKHLARIRGQDWDLGGGGSALPFLGYPPDPTLREPSIVASDGRGRATRRGGQIMDTRGWYTRNVERGGRKASRAGPRGGRAAKTKGEVAFINLQEHLTDVASNPLGIFPPFHVELDAEQRQHEVRQRERWATDMQMKQEAEPLMQMKQEAEPLMQMKQEAEPHMQMRQEAEPHMQMMQEPELFESSDVQMGSQLGEIGPCDVREEQSIVEGMNSRGENEMEKVEEKEEEQVTEEGKEEGKEEEKEERKVESSSWTNGWRAATPLPDNFLEEDEK